MIAVIHCAIDRQRTVFWGTTLQMIMIAESVSLRPTVSVLSNVHVNGTNRSRSGFMLLMANRGANNKQALWSPEEELINTPWALPKSWTSYYSYKTKYKIK